MMRATIMTSSVALLTLSACASVDLSPAPGIVNPGFEEGLSGWSTGPEPSAVEVSDVANAGANSARLRGKSAFVTQVVPIESKKTYQLSASVKGKGSLGAKVGPDLFFEQNAVSRWRTVVVTFETGTSTAVSVFGGAAGDEVFFDGFQLFEVLGGAPVMSPRLQSSRSGGTGLSPDLPPGRNFELIDWYLTTPEDADRNGKSDRVTEAELVAGYTDPRYFTTADDGGMVFRATIAGARTSNNTRYTRTELREMLRRGDTAISTKTSDGRPNKNNWVFSSAPLSAQRSAGGVDGTLRATLAVNHVTTTGDRSQVGRVIVGQIHAKDDEPARLYYRKLPGHARGSLYVAHEPSGGDDIYFELIGSRSDSSPDPADGIALDERFSYEIRVEGNQLRVRITQGDAVRAERLIDMSDSGYDVDNDYMYFKAGVYNQNASGDPDDYVQATFYALENRHGEAP